MSDQAIAIAVIVIDIGAPKRFGMFVRLVRWLVQREGASLE